MNKVPYLHELKDEYKRFFESRLALTIADELPKFMSIKKVSNAILALLTSNQEDVLALIDNNPAIKKELYRSEYYGHMNINGQIESLPAKEVLTQIMGVLQEGSKLNSVLNIHAVFVHRIYDHLTSKGVNGKHDVFLKAKKSFFKNKLFSNNLFKDRGRQESKLEAKKTDMPGINLNRFFQNRLKTKVQTHLPAKVRFVPDSKSLYVQKINKVHLPYIAGPSGHTGSFLLGALLYGKLDPSELREYALACASFLIVGGNHSFHECMTVANQINIPYAEGNYPSAIPEAIKATKGYKLLASEFPEFVAQHNECQNFFSITH